MKNMREKLKNEGILEVLKEEKFGSYKFRRAIEKAYMDESFTKYIIKNNHNI